MKKIDLNQEYSFSDYAKFTARDVAEAFSYDFQVQRFGSHRSPNYSFPELAKRLSEIPFRVALNNEQAKREALIFPVIDTVSKATSSLIEIEAELNINQHLHGSLDYRLTKLSAVAVVEAKRDDFIGGAAQLAAELIALDQWEDISDDQPQILGAVTSGQGWQFSLIERKTHAILAHPDLFTSPAQLDIIMGFFLEYLGQASTH